MSDCVFCRIVEGEVNSQTVHETETALAFLDANPLARGHTLVIPKDHFRRVNDVPPEVAGEWYATLQEVVPAVETALEAPATTVGINNGRAAGQEVPHVHAHVIPRWSEDGAGTVHSIFHDRPHLSPADRDEIAETIAAEVERGN